MVIYPGKKNQSISLILVVSIFQLSVLVLCWSREQGSRREMPLFSSGATICAAFADSYSLNPLSAVMVSNSEIADELKLIPLLCSLVGVEV